MASFRIVLGLLISVFAFSSCTKLDPSCVHGTWKDTTGMDSVFFNQLTFNEDGTGEYKNDSEGCNGNAFKTHVPFTWTESEGVLTITQDSARNHCFGTTSAPDSTYTVAYDCRDEGLWIAGVTWIK